MNHFKLKEIVDFGFSCCRQIVFLVREWTLAFAKEEAWLVDFFASHSRQWSHIREEECIWAEYKISKSRVLPFLSRLELGSSDLSEILRDFQRYRLGNDS